MKSTIATTKLFSRKNCALLSYVRMFGMKGNLHLGLAEQIRLLLNDNEIPFEDHRIPKTEWEKFKPQFVSIKCNFCSFQFNK